MALDSGVETTFSLYGVTIRSRFPFANRMISAGGPAELEFVASLEPPGVGDWSDARMVYEAYVYLRDGRPRFRVFHGPEFQVVRLYDVADFYLWDDRIWCHLLDPEYAMLVEINLLGLIMCYWLEQRGRRVLHASAVTLPGGAVGFIAGSKSGKSSLAAAFMERGYPLLTDDFLTVDCESAPVVGYPGYPQMRMWPDQARHFMGSEEGLPIVHPAFDKRRVPVGGAEGLGEFHPEAAVLRTLYLPERRDPGEAAAPQISDLSPRDAVIELVTRSFLGPMLTGIGLDQDRFASFVTLARSVPIRRLIYPHGTDRLPEVLDAILKDQAG
jgi:hypothetical protein